MIRVYLDQKDYIRIARGMDGDANFKEDYEIYNELLNKVNASKVTVYFSSQHFIEAMKYSINGSLLLNNYCKIVDSLTKGNCLININEISKREVELLLSKEFKFQTKIDENEYPYGKYGDCFTTELDMNVDINQEIRNRVKRNIEMANIPSNLKKIVLNEIKNPQRFKEHLSQAFDDNTLAVLSKAFPSSLSKTETKSLLTDTNPEQNYKKFVDSISNFTNLVTHYRKEFTDINQLGSLFNDISNKLLYLIDYMQYIQNISNQSIKLEHLEKKLFDKMLNSYSHQIIDLAKKHNFDYDKAIECVTDKRDQYLKTDVCQNKILLEYIKRHKGKLDKARKAKENDLMDILHMNISPYVDYYITDKFFNEVSRNIASGFNTVVLKNTKELIKYI